MASAFVSYRRKPSAILAQLIAKDLKEQGIEVYLDIERMEGAGAFPTRLFQAIEASDVFVCLLGEETLESDWVQNEIQHAHETARPMIPVFQESFMPLPLDQAPSPYIRSLLEYDGVYIFDVKNVYVPQAVEALARMIENTAAWAKHQTPAAPDGSQVPILSVNIEALTGQEFGQYEIRELLGIGGMSAVYKAHQASLMRDVAIKVLPPSFAAQPKTLERFLREARTAAALEHTHIVPVYDYGNYGGLSFVVMRLLSGGSLAQRLSLAEETDKPLPSLYEVADILKQLASALDYAHSRGVIHRDIKTNNVMFDDQGHPYLVDFGIAKLTSATNVLTGTGVSMGTPLYMAPEQWRGESVTPATDQYALGVTTYAMVTGHLPFEAPTPYALMHKHLTEQPPPPESWRADLPGSIKTVLEQAMAKRPQYRFPSAEAFAEAFEKAVQDSGQYNQPTDFFIAPLPSKPAPTASPLVEGTPEPQASPHPATPSPVSVQTTPPPQPDTNSQHHPTPNDEPLPLTNPEATVKAGSPPLAVHSAQAGTPLPGQSVPAKPLTPMDQAQIFIPPREPDWRRRAQWLLVGILSILVVGIPLFILLSQSQQQAAIEATRIALDSTSQAVQLQLTIDSATQAADALSATATPPPTASPTPATPVVQAINDVAARSGPGADFPIVATLAANDKLDVVGISQDGGWYQVILPDGSRGWIVTSASLVNVFGNVTQLAVDSATSTPTASPKASLTATLSHTATPTLTLHTGGRAQVSAGEFGLPMRQDAGSGSDLVMDLLDQTLVDIVDGPKDAEEVQWWKVRSPEGKTGWVAAETDGKANLIPVES